MESDHSCNEHREARQYRACGAQYFLDCVALPDFAHGYDLVSRDADHCGNFNSSAFKV